jgi:hypothetical protein
LGTWVATRHYPPPMLRMMSKPVIQMRKANRKMKPTR